MSEELGYVRLRMLISSMFEGLVSKNRMIDFYPAKRMIKYSHKFEIRDMGGGVILIKEPSVELMTDEDLADMGFGC
jgi:hypothetical protein